MGKGVSSGVTSAKLTQYIEAAGPTERAGLQAERLFPPPVPVVGQKSNRAASVDVDRYKEISGTGQDWAETVYGDYYAISVPVYSAVRIRSEALARPPLVVVDLPRPMGSSGREDASHVDAGVPGVKLSEVVFRWAQTTHRNERWIW